MRWAFVYRQPFKRQLALLEALKTGAKGEQIEAVAGFDGVRDVDGLILYGIGGESRDVFDAYKNAGKRVVFFDKGYSRGDWLRVSVDSFQPLREVERTDWPLERVEALGLKLKPYRTVGTHILFDGGSNKYAIWQRFGDWIEWGARMVRKIEYHSDLPIIYRPRPSHNGGVPVPGAELSLGPLDQDLARARVIVSYGGNIGFDAVVAGVPHFAIGDSIARCVSQTDWSFIDRPYVPTTERRMQWLSAVACSQFRLEEIANGVAWRHVRKVMDAVRPV